MRRRILLITVFIMFAYWGVQHMFTKYADPNDKFLKNKVAFTGRVLSVKQSGNHAFGVILLQVDSSNVEAFMDTLKNGIYPYKIKNGKAELYVTIPDSISRGDVIEVRSDSRTFSYVKSGQRHEGDLGVATYSGNISFVKENTALK